MIQLQGKTALVTGASRGIGRAIALSLARRGLSRIVLVARDEERLKEVAREIETHGTKATVFPLDLTETETVSRTIPRVWQECGGIDLLINAAGIAHQTSFLRSRFSRVQDEISLNLLGTYAITRSIARRMALRRRGTIVNVSSLMGQIAAPTMTTYSATKFALLGFTRALRSELRDYNIQVIALLPTLTDTDMIRDLALFRWLKPMPAERVAEGLIEGLQNRRTEIVIGWQSHLALWCQKFAPWLMEKIVDLATPPSELKRKRRWKEVFS
ncbi:SDR family NAD(P)-dependent oxidoreductase [Pannus brasiliensis CCIBt3594]|uniref:SDR family NAD(P)-dependent oxidoreductase n=1 Tax=Pannus brasiliensis CCIBt3594 TaxID=1427578 RepID=A0AAW9QYG6_9CHRO